LKISPPSSPGRGGIGQYLRRKNWKRGKRKKERLKENEGRQKINGNLKLKALNKCKKGKNKAQKGAHGINFAKMRNEKKISSGNMVFRPIYCPLS
jgi:hypothetical protein